MAGNESEGRETTHEAVSPNAGNGKPAPGVMIPSALGGYPALSSAYRRPGRPQDPAQTVSPQLVLAAIRHWWSIAAPVGILLAAGAGALVWYFHQDMYESSALIRIFEHRPVVVAPDNTGSPRYERLVQSEIVLIQKPVILEPALQQVFSATEDAGGGGAAARPGERALTAGESEELAEFLTEEDPVRWLSQKIQVSLVKGSEYIQIACQCREPGNAKRIVEAVVNSYLSYYVNADRLKMKEILDELQTAKDDQEKLVESLRQDLRAAAEQTTGVDSPAIAGALQPRPDEEDEMAHARIASAQSMLLDVELETARLEAEIQVLRELVSEEDAGEGVESAFDGQPGSAPKSLVDQVPENLVEEALAQSPELQALDAKLDEARVRLEELKKLAARGEDDPRVKQQAEKIQKDEAQREQRRQELAQKYRQQMAADLHQRRRSGLAESQRKLKEAQLRLTYLQTWLEKQRSQLKDVGQNTLDLQFEQTELEQADQMYAKIAERIALLQVEQKAPDRVELVQPASTPRAPSYDNLIRNIAALCAICFCLPFGLAVAWEIRVRRVNTGRDIEQTSHLPVLGEIAQLPRSPAFARGVSRTRRQSYELGLFEESVDALRTRLLLSQSLQDVQVIAVTSGTVNEGKTSLSIEIGSSISRALDEVVLVVDGDLRSPDVHSLLDLPLEPGLAGVLSGDCDLDDAIRTDWDRQLHVLPAGVLRVNPHQLLATRKWPALVEQLRSRYRYIVIDTPPVLVASEALALAREADATLIATMRGVSRVEQVAETRTRLQDAGANPVGVVLAGVPATHYRHAYGQYTYDTYQGNGSADGAADRSTSEDEA